MIIAIPETIHQYQWIRGDTLIREPVRDQALLLVINEALWLEHYRDRHAHKDQIIVVEDVLFRNDDVLPHEILFLLWI